MRDTMEAAFRMRAVFLQIGKKFFFFFSEHIYWFKGHAGRLKEGVWTNIISE